jgi:hypothetical protein
MNWRIIFGVHNEFDLFLSNINYLIVRLKFLPTNFCIILLSVLTFESSAQTGKDISVVDSLFYGVWKGSSLCQVKNSPCHDENVVYYISKTNKDNTIEIRANKIVSGEEVEMGKIQFQYDAKTKQLISISQPNAILKFKRKQDTIEGTLYYNNTLYRIIKVTKG